MKFIISHDLSPNWYVSEFYKRFNEKMCEVPGLEIEFIPIQELSIKYNINYGYNQNLPSVFNPYNLIIINKQNDKTFIHSWHDYAPVILENDSGINNFDIVKFSCVSRLNHDVIKKYPNIKIQPSVYLLEYWNDLDLLEKNRWNSKAISKIFFNGFCYGNRIRYKEILSNSPHFDFKDKDIDYKSKEEYYRQLSEYKYGLSLDGAAKICYRDLECFGMEALMFRERLDVLTYEPIIGGVHYVELFDNYIVENLYNLELEYVVLDKINEKVQNVLEDEKLIKEMTHNSRGWYERNCLPDSQLNIMFSFLEDFTIFN